MRLSTDDSPGRNSGIRLSDPLKKSMSDRRTPMKKMLALLAACSALAYSTGALAQTATQPMGASPHVERAMQQLQIRFSTANTTHDGKLTREQAASGMPRVAQHFDEIDTQKKGYVTLPQIEQFMQQRAASH
jgi:hypothetical protein